MTQVICSRPTTCRDSHASHAQSSREAPAQRYAPGGADRICVPNSLALSLMVNPMPEAYHSGMVYIWARVKRRYERLQLRSAITTQNMWFTVCSDRGPYVAIPLFRLCLWLKLPVGRMTFQSFDVRVRHWSSRSGLVFLGSCKMACRQVYMR